MYPFVLACYFLSAGIKYTGRLVRACVVTMLSTCKCGCYKLGRMLCAIGSVLYRLIIGVLKVVNVPFVWVWSSASNLLTGVMGSSVIVITSENSVPLLENEDSDVKNKDKQTDKQTGTQISAEKSVTDESHSVDSDVSKVKVEFAVLTLVLRV